MNGICQLRLPNQDRLFEQIKVNASMNHDMVTANSRTGQSVVICGAGPSLSDYEDFGLAHELWACNSALPYLMKRGIRVTHGFAIDHSEGMLDDWRETFDVQYLLASSVHPKLIGHLNGRRIQYFHSYLGIPDPEDWNSSPCPWPLPGKKVTLTGSGYEHSLYTDLYPTSVMVGHGLNSVPRAVCLALAMGFTSIKVYGADCAARPEQSEMPETGEPGYYDWMRNVTLYADGRPASVYGESVMCEAVIDGRRWTTRADMVISAQHLLELRAGYPDRIELVGDTLPNALKNQSKDFWSRSPKLGEGEVSNFRTLKEQAA